MNIEAHVVTAGRMAPSRPAHKLFFALQPDGPAAERIAALSAPLERRFAHTARPVGASRWHITLQLLSSDGTPPAAGLVAGAKAAAARIDRPAFLVELDRAVSWKGRAGGRPLVLRGQDGVIGVELLGAHIQAAMADAGLACGRGSEFIPHLTLLWGEHQLAEQPVTPVRWLAREFVLIHGQPGRHTVLGRWPLRTRG